MQGSPAFQACLLNRSRYTRWGAVLRGKKILDLSLSLSLFPSLQSSHGGDEDGSGLFLFFLFFLSTRKLGGLLRRGRVEEKKDITV